MKNKITDLRNHLFAALERLNEEGLSPEQLKAETQRADSIAKVAQVIVNSATAEVKYIQAVGAGEGTGFISEEKFALK